MADGRITAAFPGGFVAKQDGPGVNLKGVGVGCVIPDARNPIESGPRSIIQR